MASSQSTPINGSTQSLISGQPGLLSGTEDFIDDFDSVFSEAIDQTLELARDEIRTEALSDPAWAEYADLLNVEYTDGSFHYVLVGDDDRVQEALDLEYGGSGTLPRSLVRKVANRSEGSLGRMLSDQVNAELPNA